MRPAPSPGGIPPAVSVVIPAFSSEGTIGRCLAGLESQTFPDFETIVFDSSPNELTSQVVRARFPWVQLRRSLSQVLPHAARNAGFASARGRVLVSLDPDCVPVAEWLERLVAPLGEGQAVVGGAIECAQRDWFSRGVHVAKFSWLLPGGPPGPRPMLVTANQAWLKAEWEAFGPFSVPLWAADTELDWRLRSAGRRLYFEPRAVVSHIHQATPVSFWRERRSRGEDFARMRAAFDRWSPGRVALYLLGMLIEPLVILSRTLGSAARAGRLGEAVMTSPVCVLGSLAWALGEAQALVALLRESAVGSDPTPASGG